MSESWPSLSAPNGIISQLVINLLRELLKKKSLEDLFSFHLQTTFNVQICCRSELEESRLYPQPIQNAWDVSTGSVLAAAAGNAEMDKKGVRQGRRGLSVFVRTPDSPGCGRQNFERHPSGADGGCLLC